MSINHAIFTGRMGRDPELRYTSNGTAVCDIRVAVQEGKDEVSWVGVTLWKQSAEFCGEYGRKGAQVIISGRLKEEKWEDKEGNSRSKLKVIAHRIEIPFSGQKPVESEPPPASDDDDDLPF